MPDFPVLNGLKFWGRVTVTRTSVRSDTPAGVEGFYRRIVGRLARSREVDFDVSLINKSEHSG